MRVEICGGIGAGKTTLAKLLGNYEFSLIIEDFKLNPFWEPFFSNPEKFNFETEITFLLLHYHEVKRYQEFNKDNVCDFSFFQDLAYAKKGLSGSRLNIFERIFSEVIKEFDRPDLLICLKCEADVLLERIRNRGRVEELSITIEFLETLTSNIYQEVARISSSTRILYIDSQKLNFAFDPEDQKAVVRQVKESISLISHDQFE